MLDWIDQWYFDDFWVNCPLFSVNHCHFFFFCKLMYPLQMHFCMLLNIFSCSYRRVGEEGATLEQELEDPIALKFGSTCPEGKPLVSNYHRAEKRILHVLWRTSVCLFFSGVHICRAGQDQPGSLCSGCCSDSSRILWGLFQHSISLTQTR